MNLTNFHFVDIGRSRVYYYSENMAAIDNWFQRAIRHYKQNCNTIQISQVTVTNIIDSDIKSSESSSPVINVETVLSNDEIEDKSEEDRFSIPSPQISESPSQTLTEVVDAMVQSINSGDENDTEVEKNIEIVEVEKNIEVTAEIDMNKEVIAEVDKNTEGETVLEKQAGNNVEQDTEPNQNDDHASTEKPTSNQSQNNQLSSESDIDSLQNNDPDELDMSSDDNVNFGQFSPYSEQFNVFDTERELRKYTEDKLINFSKNKKDASSDKTNVAQNSQSAPRTSPTDLTPPTPTTSKKMPLPISPQKFKCKFCIDRQYTKKAKLVEHVKQKHPDKYDPADFKYNKMSKSVRQMLVEMPGIKRAFDKNGKQVFHCTKCSPEKQFYKSQHAARHYERTHLGKKNATCETCGKQFTSLKNYRVHVLMHKGVKPFKCLICGKEFRRSDKLTEHLKTLHKVGKDGNKLPIQKIVEEEKKSEKDTVEDETVEKEKEVNSNMSEKTVNSPPDEKEPEKQTTASKTLPDLPVLIPRPSNYRDPVPILPSVKNIFIQAPKLSEKPDDKKTKENEEDSSNDANNKKTSTENESTPAKKKKRNLSSPSHLHLTREQLAELIGKNPELLFHDDLSFGDVMNWESINPKMDMLQ